MRTRRRAQPHKLRPHRLAEVARPSPDPERASRGREPCRSRGARRGPGGCGDARAAASHGIDRPSRVGTRRAIIRKKVAARDRCGRVHADRAPAPQDNFFRSEGAGPNWRPEKLFLRRESWRILRLPQGFQFVVAAATWSITGQSTPCSRTQHVCSAVPLRTGHLGHQFFGKTEARSLAHLPP